MKKSNFILLIFIAATALAISFLIQRRADAALRQNENSLRQQQDEIARAAAESQRPSNRPARAADTSKQPDDYSAELRQLQSRAGDLRSQENQLSNQLWKSRLSAGTRLLASENYDLTNHNETIGGSSAGTLRVPGKLNDARAFTAAMQRYAREHEGVFPLSLDLVTSYLPPPLTQNSKSWENAPVSGTNDFEIVYQGGTNELANIPLRRIALIRERQPWLTPDGKWARTYGYVDGDGEIDTSDDNFQSWDALHIIPPSATP
jgi:hypothetical protein